MATMAAMATTAAARTHDALQPTPTNKASGGDDDDESLQQMRVLRDANALLAQIGFGARQFARFEDLVASVSSMSVALYEKLFQLRLEHIVRVPRSLADYEANAQLVVDALADALLEHSSSADALTGAALCAGDTHSIARVVRMFEQVLDILEEASATRDERTQVVDASDAYTAATKRRATKTKAAATRTAAVRTRHQRPSVERSDSDSSDSGDSDSSRIDRPPRGLLRERELPRRTEQTLSAANLYETSDASITRSRGGALAPRSSRAAPVDNSNDAAHALSNSDVAAKKRSRRLSASPIESPEAPAVHPAEIVAASARHRRPESKKLRAKTHRNGTTAQTDATAAATTSSSKSKRRVRASDPTLLATQRYGRFVPVATTQSTRRASRRSARTSERDDEHAAIATTSVGTKRLDADALDKDDGAAADAELETPMYFGGVSSVSNGSRSDGSVHFLEDDDTDSRDFSTSRVGVDLQNVPPLNARSPSNAYDDTKNDNGDDDDKLARGRQTQQQSHSRSRSRSRTAATRGAQASGDMVTKSRNQEDSESNGPDRDDDGARGGDATTSSDPATRQALLPRALRDSASKSGVDGRASEPAPTAAAPLYPLLPKGGAATSKAAAEFQRYKLFLKDHLQDLRQREFCQRQHMERAYKNGEHTANVERIRARRFQQDVRLQRIAIGLETRNEEETRLRQTLAHILALEKAKLRDEHRATASALQQIQHAHAQRESALETFYANQIKLVKEQTHREVQERELVEKAHRLASEQMLREMRREREQQVAALLREQQHLEEARRFRSASQLARTLEHGDSTRARTTHSRTDAFYTAAMRARELHANSSGARVAVAGRAKTAPKTKTKQKTAAAYSSVRPAPVLRRRVK